MADASLAPRLCAHCGAEFTSKFPTSKYCGKACWLNAEYERRKVRRAAEAALSLARRDPATGKMRPILPSRQCDNCGKNYQPKTRHSRYCSRDCTFAHPGWKEAMRKPKRTRCSGACQSCGKDKASRRARYCETCRANAEREARDRRLAALAVRRVEKSCACCGRPFWSLPKGRFCSPACGARASRWRRQQRLRSGRQAEAFAPWQVFVRDGWKCYLCGIATPMGLVGRLAPNAPTVDHVVPLARGGRHEFANTRCACRECNSRKSDNRRGQSSLF